MIKKILLFSTILTIISSSVQAGLITHNDYTSGNTITAAGQNANENTIVNEVNGNLDNTNIKSGGVTGTNIANGTITGTNLNANIVISSATATYLNVSTISALGTNIANYILVYSSTVYVQSANDTSTSSTFSQTHIKITVPVHRSTSHVELTASFTLFTNASSVTGAFATLENDSVGNLAPGTASTAFFCETGGNVTGTNINVCTINLIDVPGMSGNIVYSVYIRNTDNSTTIGVNPSNAVGLITVKEWSY